jgi:hypothetical protein
MNKKGFYDLLLIPLIIFVIILSVFVTVIMLREFMTEINIVSPTVFNLTDSSITNAITTMDIFAPVVLIGIGIVFIIVSYTIPSHPILFVLGLFVMVIGVILTAGLSNALEELNASTSGFTGSALPITKGIQAYLPHIVFTIAVLGALAFYGKTSGSGNI